MYWAVSLNPNPYRYVTFVTIILLETHFTTASGCGGGSGEMGKGSKKERGVTLDVDVGVGMEGGDYDSDNDDGDDNWGQTTVVCIYDVPYTSFSCYYQARHWSSSL